MNCDVRRHRLLSYLCSSYIRSLATYKLQVSALGSDWRARRIPLLFLSLPSILLKRNAGSILCNYHASSILRHVVHLRWDLGPSEAKGRFGFINAEISSALLQSALDKPFCREKKKILFWQIAIEAEWSWTSQLGLHLYSTANKSFSRANSDWRGWIHRPNLRQKGTPQSFSWWVFLTNCCTDLDHI